MVRQTWQGRAVVAVIGALALGGCNASNQAADSGTNFDPGKMHPVAAGNHAAVAAGYDEMPTPPADARYTIYCQAYAGPDHQENARRVRDTLRANTSFKKWYVVHTDQQSTLYYGFYRTLDKRDATDGAEGERALADLNAIRTLHDSRGTRLFGSSLPVPIDSPNPDANPAWDITRSGGYWSLEIAVFKDTPDRKVRAVEAVAEARSQGIPAYYYHGEHASSVCIGAWPRAAASELTVADQNADPSLTPFVTPTPMSPEMARSLGPNVQAVAPHVEPVDPAMIQAIAGYPSHSVNGYTIMKPDAAGQPTNVPAEHSFLFRIPSALTADGGAVAGSAAGAVPYADGAALAPPSAPGSGQLRSLGD